MKKYNSYSLGRSAAAIAGLAMMLVAAGIAVGHQAAREKPGGTEEIIHYFQNSQTGGDGYFPAAGLVSDKAGNLYGTTTGGGTYLGGTAFELSPQQNGDWVETILYNFSSEKSGAQGGFNPHGGLVIDGTGNLYGTTLQGGDCTNGCGIVYELSPQSNGSWEETVLYKFQGGTTGYNPWGIVMDPAGNLFGTASGGTGFCKSSLGNGCGMVFELSAQEGVWTETALYMFQGNGQDGTNPETGLTLDSAGNLYGVTYAGGGGTASACGRIGCGTVFELSPQGDGTWVETILHSFDGTDGTKPDAPVTVDSAGNIYGTASLGGTGGCRAGCGTVFELTPQSGGGWVFTVLHSFQKDGHDGAIPSAPLLLDTSGQLFGTTEDGGIENCSTSHSGCGTIFEVAPGPEGWSERIIYSFKGLPQDGANPSAGLIVGKEGRLFGTTYFGGNDYDSVYGYGTVYEIARQ